MTTTAPQTQTKLPAPGTWTIDSSHSSVEFVVRHLMVAKVRGRFSEFSGTIQVGDTPEASSVEVSISP
ncbi:MAG: YceI family protein, partial [Acidimicrobiia bacterium]